MSLGRRLGAEFIGTFWLVFAGTGSAVIAARFSDVGIGLVGIALAFGLSLMVMAYAIGAISGCHINPAVTFGMAVAQRFPWKEVIPYFIAQVLGAIAGSGIVYAIASGQPAFSLADSALAANGYGTHSPGGYSLVSGLIAEVILTFIFLFVILGATNVTRLARFAPIAIGLTLTVIHLISIPVTNTSVNPARSTGPAVFVGDWALTQLWFFWLFPLIGAALAGFIYPRLAGFEEVELQEPEERRAAA